MSTQVYAIVKDGKFLSSLSPVTFGLDKPVFGKIYFYRNRLIAQDIASILEAELRQVELVMPEGGVSGRTADFIIYDDLRGLKA